MYTNVGRVPSTWAFGSQKQPGNGLARFAFATAHIVTRDMYSRASHAELNLRVEGWHKWKDGGRGVSTFRITKPESNMLCTELAKRA